LQRSARLRTAFPDDLVVSRRHRNGAVAIAKPRTGTG
jgi:hypothetical protein